MAIQPLRLDPITVLGKQLVIELFDCVDQRFDDIQWIEESMLEAARQANATIITSAFHKFSPIGISGVVVIAESHLAIHTWPEYGYALARVQAGELLAPQLGLSYAGDPTALRDLPGFAALENACRERDIHLHLGMLSPT
ncbi:adenosylmethionine decarboxylase, partial [Pseudomonas aeruginosa]|nr:adenosylmethionine decarboxylase [Pseudomonas aeruginosa]